PCCGGSVSPQPCGRRGRNGEATPLRTTPPSSGTRERRGSQGASEPPIREPEWPPERLRTRPGREFRNSFPQGGSGRITRGGLVEPRRRILPITRETAGTAFPTPLRGKATTARPAAPTPPNHGPGHVRGRRRSAP